MEDGHNLIFKPETHKYFLDGKELVSCSTLVKFFSPTFDEKGEIIKRCADREGITVEELQKRWDKEKNDAADRGNSFHTQAQYWVENKKVGEGDYKDIVKQLTKFKFKGKLIAERKVYNKDFGIAGTIDLTEIFKNNVKYLYDYKTNKKLKMRGFFDREKRRFTNMLDPIKHLEDCNFVHYSLQLSLYRLIEEENGSWVDGTEILYVNPKTRQIERYPVKYYRKECLRMIEQYKKINAI